MSILKKYVSTAPLREDEGPDSWPNCQRVYLASWADMEMARITNELDTTARQLREQQDENFALSQDYGKLEREVERLINRCATLQEEINCAGVTTDKLQAEIARLSSPPEERKDIAERQTAYREQLIASDSLSSVSAEAAVRDIDTLLQDLARARNALNDRVRMLGIVQDALSERNRENVELRAKCERLEKESINADGDLQLRDERIEQLQGALRKYANHHDDCDSRETFVYAGGKCDCGLDETLTASQHTAGTGDGVAGD